MIEARLPQMPLFQGSKVPKFSTDTNETISFPLSHTFQKIFVSLSFCSGFYFEFYVKGDSVRIYVYHDNMISRSVFPTLLSFKSIIFLIILVLPVIGTCLSLVLADKSTQILFK